MIVPVVLWAELRKVDVLEAFMVLNLLEAFMVFDVLEDELIKSIMMKVVLEAVLQDELRKLIPELLDSFVL